MKLNANRKVIGVLRGFDQFMNLVLENSVEVISETEKHEIGMTVRPQTQCHENNPAIKSFFISLSFAKEHCFFFSGNSWQQCGSY